MDVSLIHTCTGHRNAVYALAPGHSARHVLSAGGDGWIVEWDLDHPETGRVLATVETQVFSLATAPGGSRLVAGNMNGGLHWIDLAHPDRTRHIQHHQKGIFDLFFHDQWLFSAGGDGIITRWAWEEARPAESYQLSNKSLRALALSPAREELAVGASDGAIYLLDAQTLRLRQTLPGAHAPSVFTVCYSPDQRYLLSGGRDAMLRGWDLENDAALIFEQPAHWFTINHLSFAPDGLFLATASRDKTIKIWDAHSFQLLRVVDTIRDGGHINSVNRLLWLPGGLVSASDDRTMKIWQVESAH